MSINLNKSFRSIGLNKTEFGILIGALIDSKTQETDMRF